MSTPLHIEKTATADGTLVYFGPIDPETKRQLAIPATFERQIIDKERSLFVTLSCVFSGSKVEVTRLLISAGTGGHISSRAIAQLGLPTFIREVTKAVTPNWEYWDVRNRLNGELDSGNSNFAFLAQIYWLEFASHGAPRQTIMNLLKMPRSTCNVLLRKIRKDFDLPSDD